LQTTHNKQKTKTPTKVTKGISGIGNLCRPTPDQQPIIINQRQIINIKDRPVNPSPPPWPASTSSAWIWACQATTILYPSGDLHPSKNRHSSPTDREAPEEGRGGGAIQTKYEGVRVVQQYQACIRARFRRGRPKSGQGVG